MDYYILNDKGEPEPCDDTLKWGAWLEKSWQNGRQVGLTNITPKLHISTVFLGIDHSFAWKRESPPVLWESMAFAENKKALVGITEMRRCSGSREQAEAMHHKMCEDARAAIAART